MPLNTPILFLIFNRPDTTIQVFEEIRKQSPKQIFIAADGPRKHVPGEIEICKSTREIVLSNIDWKCEVKTLFRETNLGCGKAVSSAISWFFNNVEEGIIIEDDCLPSESFFVFCESLLSRYRYNNKISLISGINFRQKPSDVCKYFYTAYSPIWGWASWRRTWLNYDFKLDSINKNQVTQILKNYFKTDKELQYWKNIFYKMKDDPIDTWDYQLAFSNWKMKTLNIMPNINLVSNIGFNFSGTHTNNFIQGVSNLERYNFKRIEHNTIFKQNRKEDLFIFKKMCQNSAKKSIINILKIRIVNLFNNGRHKPI